MRVNMRKKILSCILFMVLLLTGCRQIIIPQAIPEYIRVTVSDTVFENKFYFQQLSESEQMIYKEVYQGLLDSRKEITVHGNNTDLIHDITNAVLLDFAELFWADGGGNFTTYGDGYTVLQPTYLYVGEEKDKRQTEIQNEVGRIISSMPVGLNEYEKIKYIYEYLIETVTYVEDAPDNQNIYSSIIGKASVCAGYAKANQYLLEQLGISCIYVVGTAMGEEGEDAHAWNIVKCNNQYYYIDVTWADSAWIDGDGQMTGELLYDYLCCDEQSLSETHHPEEQYVYPRCSANDLNYYRINQMYYDVVNRSELLKVMYTTIEQKERCTIFKFSNSSLYNEAKKLFVDELINKASQYLGELYRLQEVQCTYEEQDELNKFVIYWLYQ